MGDETIMVVIINIKSIYNYMLWLLINIIIMIMGLQGIKTILDSD